MTVGRDVPTPCASTWTSTPGTRSTTACFPFSGAIYDPLVDDPELARTLSASVPQRIAFGERAGQRVRRIDSGSGYEGEGPTLSGTHCASVHGFSLHANTDIPAHRRDQLERLIATPPGERYPWSA
jgi:hypothetical protein